MKEIDDNCPYNYKGICYGILFYLLFDKIYYFLYRIVENFVLILNINILIVPLLLFLVIIFMGILYYNMQVFPQLKWCYFIIIVFLSIMDPFIFKKSYEITKDISSGFYFDYKICIYACNTVFFILFLVISWYKYNRLMRKNKDKE